MSDTVYFHICFRITLLISMKTPCWDFIEIALNLWISVRKINISTILIFPGCFVYVLPHTKDSKTATWNNNNHFFSLKIQELTGLSQNSHSDFSWSYSQLVAGARVISSKASSLHVWWLSWEDTSKWGHEQLELPIYFYLSVFYLIHFWLHPYYFLDSTLWL